MYLIKIIKEINTKKEDARLKSSNIAIYGERI